MVVGFYLKCWDVLGEVDLEAEAGQIFVIRKMKEIKINGKIGGVGEKDKLSYVSLSYQISNAKKLGYAEEMICTAVIKVITPGSHFLFFI